MVRGRHKLTMTASAAAMALALSACIWTFAEPSVVDDGFGNDGALTFTVEENQFLDGRAIGADELLVVNRSTGAVAKYGADGAPDPAWTSPTLSGQLLVRGLLDGTMTTIETVSGQPVLRRYTADGNRIESVATPITVPGPFRQYGTSTAGNVAIAASVCDAEGCNALTVQSISADGTARWTTTVPMDEWDLGCATTTTTASVQALNSGEVTIAQRRCSEANSTALTGIVIRRLTAEGAIDETYADGAGFAVLSGPGSQRPVEVIHSQTGQVLAKSGSYRLQRVTPDGLFDTVFGERAGTAYVDGRGPDDIEPNGEGYTLTARASEPHCGVTATTVAFVRPDGTLASSFVTSVPLGSSSIIRYPDGNMVLRGVHQTTVPYPDGNGYSCTAPRTFTFLRLIAPTPE